jgi:plastocyanin
MRHLRPTLAGLLSPLSLLLLATSGCGGGSDDPVVPPGNGNGPSQFGVLAGVVSHSDHGVGNVGVTLRDGPGADRQATTPNDGSFSFPNLEPGTWTLEVSPPDYFQLAPGQAAVRTVQVSAGVTASADVVLAPVVEPEGVYIEATSGLSFSPSSVQVVPGARIRWVNTSNELHTVTPQGHTEWSEGTIAGQGDVFEAVMNNPGDFSYFCVPHQGDGMNGSLTVVP